MAVFKCKMCGGDLNITNGVTVVECEYCGTKQTVPALDNEKKSSLFGRANRLRFACEFDKAAGVYESIVAEFSDEAEAYWGLVLCKYGIEYVDDPATAKKIPTCHRSSFDSVFDDGNFEQVMENADALSRQVYRDEAKQIEELRKGIIEVSSKEEPYDIFICYKETAENGDRTLDSVIAQDVYKELVAMGYRVFFSRITLEDKLGVEYEPYIFAALNSAKIMLAFGTSYDYYNAVWVKNEWSRFLQLIAKGEKKTLIPCYKNIDVYDMPKEFAKLQAQDMGKVGAIQDLLRGIEKIIPKKVAKPEIIKETVVSRGNATTDSLLKRAFMFLEDGDFAWANEYAEKVLDIDAENAEAYLVKLMADLKAKKREDIKEIKSPIDKNPNYIKALKYADDELANTLKEYEDTAKNNSLQKKKKKKKITSIILGAVALILVVTFVLTSFNFNRPDIVAISAGYRHTVGLKADGTVVAVGDNYRGRCDVSDWTDIVAISAGMYHTVGLKKDGTVVVVGYNFNGQCDVTDWTDIVAISAGDHNTVGLKSDGTVVAVGDNYEGQCDVEDWTDIVAISAGGGRTVGLKSDGTVVAVGDNDDGECDVEDWTDIVAISAGGNHTVGLKKDGTVVAVGYNKYGQCGVKDWTDIVAISAGVYHTVGLKKDGTVVVVGRNKQGQCDVEDWTDIVAISADSSHTVGLKKDGTVVAVGDNDDGQCNVSDFVPGVWKGFFGIS